MRKQLLRSPLQFYEELRGDIQASRETRPEVLLYEPDGNGGWSLAGVSYLAVKQKGVETPPEGFAAAEGIAKSSKGLSGDPAGAAQGSRLVSSIASP